MADKLKYIPIVMIHKIIPSVDSNWWLKCLNTQLNERTNQNLTEIRKVVKSPNKKTLL